MEPDTRIVDQYQERLERLPRIDQELQAQIDKYQDLVQDQEKQLGLQQIRIKALQSDLIKMDKIIETRDNEINQLSESEEKNVAKQKKYFMQIENYNKKIESSRSDITKLQKSIQLLKKDIKTLQSTISTCNTQKNKILQTLTKDQIKANNMAQTLNDLKLKLMQQYNIKQSNEDSIKKDQKQIAELFNAIKKQMALIDVLKRQKVHVIASTVFKYCEEEFEQVLQMNKNK